MGIVYIPKSVVDSEKLQKGDKITFAMPGFCSGDYTYTVNKTKLLGRFYISGDLPKNIFASSTEYFVYREGNLFEFGELAKFDIRFTCKQCECHYKVDSTQVKDNSAICPKCDTVNNKAVLDTPLDSIIWEIKWQEQVLNP